MNSFFNTIGYFFFHLFLCACQTHWKIRITARKKIKTKQKKPVISVLRWEHYDSAHIFIKIRRVVHFRWDHLLGKPFFRNKVDGFWELWLLTSVFFPTLCPEKQALFPLLAASAHSHTHVIIGRERCLCPQKTGHSKKYKGGFIWRVVCVYP